MNTRYLLSTFLILISFYFSGCTTKKAVQPKEIKDIQTYPQEASAYLSNIPKISYYDQVLLDEQFNKYHFAPWHIKKLYDSKKDAMWGHSYAQKKVYGDNHRRISKQWFAKQIENSSFKHYNSILEKSITVRNSNLRVFPTSSKIFYNPQKAGEGFPFDYNQNSGIKINTPLLISHLSKDRAWAYVQASFASGWIKINDIAYVSNELAKKFETNNYYVAIKDNFPLYKENVFQEYIKLGTIFPKTKTGKYLTINKGVNLKGYLSTVVLTEKNIDKKPIKINKKNIGIVLNELINEPYGWGEVLTHRDCSAMTRDFMTPFGIYLNRNSKAQTRKGKFHDIQGLTPKEKKAFILNNGLPFMTLIYMRGHIMLYIGEKDGEPLAFHNVWGLKTLKENGEFDRFIIGRAVITTLNPGTELKNIYEPKTLIHRISGIVNITQKHPNAH